MARAADFYRDLRGGTYRVASFQIRGAGLAKSDRPRVTIGDMERPS